MLVSCMDLIVDLQNYFEFSIYVFKNEGFESFLGLFGFVR